MQNSNATLTGGCLCGGVRYELREWPLMAWVCHCSLCRRFSGAANQPGISVPYDGFTLTAGGELVRVFRWEDRKDYVFCSRCGCSLFTLGKWPPATGTHVNVRLGTLDPANALPTPSRHIYVGSKAPWEQITDDLPQQD